MMLSSLFTLTILPAMQALYISPQDTVQNSAANQVQNSAANQVQDVPIPLECLRVPNCSECPVDMICTFKPQTKRECATVTCSKPIMKICDKMAIQCQQDSCPDDHECIVKAYDPLSGTCGYTQCIAKI